MKRYFLYLLVILSVTSLYAQQKAQYKVKSGEIIYEISYPSDPKTKNKDVVYFKDYGRVEVYKSIRKNGDFVIKRENGKVYSVDTIHKDSFKSDLDSNRLNLSALEYFIKVEGAKKIGSDEILGLPCDIWESKKIKVCLYKEVALKVEIKKKDFTINRKAISAKFDIKIPEEKFALPKY